MSWEDELATIVAKKTGPEKKVSFWTWLRQVGYYHSAKVCCSQPTLANLTIYHGYWLEYQGYLTAQP